MITPRRLRFGLLTALALLAASRPAAALTLAEAVAAALLRHGGVAAALDREAAAEAGVEAAYAGYLPRLDLLVASRYGWIDLEAPSDSRVGGYWENEGRVQLRQRLWDNGRTALEVAAAEASVAGRAAGVDLAADKVALDTVEAYLAACEAVGRVALAQRDLADHRAYRALVRQQEAAGLLTLADRQQSEGRLALAEADLLAEQGRLAVAEARLASLLGWPADRLELPELPVVRLPPDGAAALRVALLASPLLAEAAAEIERRRAERAAADTLLLPTVDLVLLGRAAHELDGLEGSLLEFVALVELRWTLYDGYGSQAETRRLSSLSGAATAELADRRRRIAGRIEQALAELRGLEARLPHLAEAREAQRATLAGYRRQFDIGERSLLDLLDARRALTDIERRYLVAEVGRLRAAYRLAHAMGLLRDWIADPSAAGLAPEPSAPPAPAAPPLPATALPGPLLAAHGTSDEQAAAAPVVAPLLVAATGKHGNGPPLAQLVAERLP